MCHDMKEQVCQIYIPASAASLPARAFYHTRLNGRYKARFAGVQFCDNTTTHDHRLIRVQSNCFRMPYGSYSDSLIFGNKGGDTHGNPSGNYPFDLEVMGGGIDLTLTSSTAYDGNGNNSFFFCIITLLVSPAE